MTEGANKPKVTRGILNLCLFIFTIVCPTFQEKICQKA